MDRAVAVSKKMIDRSIKILLTAALLDSSLFSQGGTDDRHPKNRMVSAGA